nr:DUF4175 domain-containing protein [Wenxinia saemankumensis]
MVAERASRAFWPVVALVMASAAILLFGWHEAMPLEALWALAVVVGLGTIVALVRGAMRFRWPSEGAAIARIDASLPGRPLAAIADLQATGRGDAASEAVWAAHQQRMAARARAARPVDPDLRLAARDPYGLRYMALLLFVTGLLFGSIWRIGSVADIAAGAGPGQAVATGPVWEGWIEPPAYTGKPTLYLADQPEGRLDVPQGSEIALRLYGEAGDLTVSQAVTAEAAEPSAEAQQSLLVRRDGPLAIEGPGGAAWDIVVVPDAAPAVALSGPVEAEATGQMAQPFTATDDYAVVAGRAVIELDLGAVDRRFGLAAEPGPQEPVVIDLPMPFSGDRTEFSETLIDDFSQHPLANLPVTMTLTVADDAGQEGTTGPVEMILPGRRFFQPIARAVIEQRRDLMWSPDNARRVTQMLRTVAYEPEGFFPNELTYLKLSFAIRQLAADLDDDGALTDATRDEVVQALWDLAVQLEEGTLADARARLERAQERLEEAMRNGASDEEIAELMQELREATNDYIRMLAEQNRGQEDGTDQPDMSQNMQELGADQLQQMMDEIQRLMEEGRMAEAMELMQQLDQMMENLQVTEGQGQGQGQQSMEDLADTLREQQELSDDAFRQLQDEFNGRPPQGDQGQPQDGQQPGQQPGQGQPQPDQPFGPQPGQDSGQQPGDGQQGQNQGGQGSGQQPQGRQGQVQSPGDQPGQGGRQDGQGRGGEGSLADRQQALRDELNRQRGNLPSLSGEAADEAGEALDRAEGAMDEAEGALREGDTARAIDRQSEALDALRDGLRNLGEALADNRDQQQPGQGEARGNAQGRLEPQRRDPLGREFGNSGQMGTEQEMLQGEDVYRRAQELLDELRRRSGEQSRPEDERDYLRRLLEQF